MLYNVLLCNVYLVIFAECNETRCIQLPNSVCFCGYYSLPYASITDDSICPGDAQVAALQFLPSILDYTEVNEFNKIFTIEYNAGFSSKLCSSSSDFSILNVDDCWMVVTDATVLHYACIHYCKYILYPFLCKFLYNKLLDVT